MKIIQAEAIHIQQLSNLRGTMKERNRTGCMITALILWLVFARVSMAQEVTRALKSLKDFDTGVSLHR
jgi:hypothetical protein